MLVLNVLLTSAVLASVSPLRFNALHELCLNGASGVPAQDDGTGDAGPVIKCPLCLSGVTAVDLPPPSPALTIRIALQIALEPLPHEDGLARSIASSHQPRGPPHLD